MHTNWVPLAPIALIVVLLFTSAPFALDFSSIPQVYEETFDGETSFPTVPETDVHSLGGATGVGISGIPTSVMPIAPPTLAGGAAVVSLHGETPTSLKSVNVPASFAESVGVRGTFDGFTLGATGFGFVDLGPDYGGGEYLSAGVILDNSGASTGSLELTYVGTSVAATSVALDPATFAAILAGSSFTLDVHFDRATSIATGSIDVSGIGVITATPLDASAVTTLSGATPLSAIYLRTQEYFGLDLDVNMTEFSVYLGTPSPPQVPALAPLGIALLGSLLVLSGWRSLRA